MPMAAELKEKFSQFQSSKPIPLPKTDKKPQPPAKPVENKPQLPPRGHEKLPPVPPIDTTDSKSDDNSSAGSSSSGPTSSSKSVKIVSPTGPVIRNQAKVQVFPALHATIKKIEEGLSKVPIRLPNHEPPESDEIYDDAITEKLTSFDWFHGELDRKEAEKRVNQMRDNGAFLVRASTKGDPTYPYVLVVISEGKIKNLQLRQRHDKRFAIGNYKEDEVSFTNVPDLVNHHKSNNIKLADGGTVMLTRTPRK
ncbi:unnamed protein product [Lymnaea stagnalis]|uniref:SH2 domain-containing protein n=1 Tax=Lymnaea stagnalis TaxID=6523 RepID=A0AAV2GZM2_LYMST